MINPLKSRPFVFVFLRGKPNSVAHEPEIKSQIHTGLNVVTQVNAYASLNRYMESNLFHSKNHVILTVSSGLYIEILGCTRLM